MKNLAEFSGQLRQRRSELALTQKDMLMRIGMSQQQYQRIESGGDTLLSTLLRILEGMDLELMLIPRQRARPVQKMLEMTAGEFEALAGEISHRVETQESSWTSILDDLAD